MKNFEMNVDNAILILESAIEKCYAESPEGDFMAFEDLVFDLKMDVESKELSELDEMERQAEIMQHEANAAFYARFGHLGSI